jgi:hypothetical protein
MRNDVRARPTVANYTALSNRWQHAIHEVLFDNVKPAAATATQW